jgi:hypothetical protein
MTDQTFKVGDSFGEAFHSGALLLRAPAAHVDCRTPWSQPPLGRGCCGLENRLRGPSADQSKVRTSSNSPPQRRHGRRVAAWR